MLFRGGRALVKMLSILLVGASQTFSSLLSLSRVLAAARLQVLFTQANRADQANSRPELEHGQLP